MDNNIVDDKLRTLQQELIINRRSYIKLIEILEKEIDDIETAPVKQVSHLVSLQTVVSTLDGILKRISELHKINN